MNFINDDKETRNFEKMTKEKANNLLKSSSEYKEFEIEYVLIDNENLNNSITIASHYDEIIQIELDTMEIKDIFNWDYNFDDYIFEELEKGKEISYMSISTHYSIWECIANLYPEDIEHKKGMQLYLKYCKENKITKEAIEKETGQDEVSNAMKYYKNNKQKER